MRVLKYLFLIFTLLLIGCSGNDDEDDSNSGPPPTNTPAPIETQLSYPPITIENAESVDVVANVSGVERVAISTNSEVQYLAVLATSQMHVVLVDENGENQCLSTIPLTIGSECVQVTPLIDVISPDDEDLTRSFSISAVAISPNGEYLALGVATSSDRRVQIRAIPSLELVHEIEQPNVLWRLEFSPDNTKLAGLSLVGDSSFVWDVETGELDLELEGVEGGIMSFSDDSSMLLTGSRDREIRLWDLDQGTLETRIPEGAESLTGFYYVGLLPNTDMIVSADRDHLRLWDATSGDNIQTLEGYGAGVSADEATLLWRNLESNSIRLMDTTSLESTVTEFAVGSTLESRVESYIYFQYGADENLIVGANAASIRLFDLENNTMLHQQRFNGIDEVITNDDLSLIVVRYDNRVAVLGVPE